MASRRAAQSIRDQIVPHLVDAFANEDGCTVKNDGDKVFIEYIPLFEHTAYVQPKVLLEFGGRSTGEPSSEKLISCDAARHMKELLFPSVTVRAMKAERTFWEKATAIHVYCLQDTSPCERYARHWSDIVRLDEAGFADLAIADRALAEDVANHKSIFFSEKASGQKINYQKAVGGELKLVPVGHSLEALAQDYKDMKDLFYGKPPCSFDDLMLRCRSISERANKMAASLQSHADLSE